MIKPQEFKYNIGDPVSGFKPGVGAIQGNVSGRSELRMGTILYWVKDVNGHEWKIPQHYLRGGTTQ